MIQLPADNIFCDMMLFEQRKEPRLVGERVNSPLDISNK